MREGIYPELHFVTALFCKSRRGKSYAENI